MPEKRDPLCNVPRSRKTILSPDTFPVVLQKMTTSRSRGRERESELGQKTGQQKILPTLWMYKKVEKKMSPVKTCAWAKELLTEKAASGGAELAGVAEYYFV